MSRKTKIEAEKTRTRVLASALSLFAKKGYYQTTFNDIAARLKMTKGAVYWHFASKEAILKELVRLALEKFRRQTETYKLEGELTYPEVAEMMVKVAENVVSDAKAVAFFRLMKCQIKWTDTSMGKVREDLLNNLSYGPRELFRISLLNDMKQGKAKAGADADAIATASIALWDGIVQARIDHFLTHELRETLTNAYGTIWQGISKENHK